MNQKDTEALAKLRKRIFLTAYSGGAGHLASCFSALEIIYTLYRKGILNVDPANPDKPDRDRFILSKGHGGLALYSTLCDAGFLSEERLKTYLRPGCTIGGEPNMRDLKGIEASTGSLGHGLSAEEALWRRRGHAPDSCSSTRSLQGNSWGDSCPGNHPNGPVSEKGPSHSCDRFCGSLDPWIDLHPPSHPVRSFRHA